MAVIYVSKHGPNPIKAQKKPTISKDYAGQFKVHAQSSKKILKAILAGKKMTARDAAYDYEVFCLSHVIYRLRKKNGITIKKTMLQNDHEGCITRYAEYYMDQVDIAAYKATGQQ